jgi:lysophospholipase L1-like esterase
MATTTGDPSRPASGVSGTWRLLILLSLLLAFAAFSCSGALFVGSRSSVPSVFGRYSLPLFAIIVIHAASLAALAGALLFRFRRLLDAVERFLGRPGRAGALADAVLICSLPVLLLFSWLGYRITPLAAEPEIRAAAWLLYSAFAIGIWAAGGPGRLKLSLFRAALSALACLMVFVGAEIALRLLLPGSVFHPMLDLRPNVRLALETGNLPGVSPSGFYSTNKWGMRGEQPPEDWDEWFTIVCIGGSTTQCFELDDSRTWPWLLQEDIRRVRPQTWIGNGGLGGHGTRGHLVFMKEVIPEVKPDVVIFLVGVNELSSFSGFDPRERGSLGTAPLTLEYRLFCASRVVQVLYALKKGWIDGVPAQGTPWAAPYTPRPLAAPEPDVPEDLHQLMFDPDLTRDNVRQLIGLARQYGVTPVFLTQPLLFEDTMYWRGIDGGLSWQRRPERVFSAATVWRLVQTANTDVIEVCREEGVACYDLGSAIPHSMSMFYDEGHFSEAGAAAVADSVASFMIRSGLIPSQDSPGR